MSRRRPAHRRHVFPGELLARRVVLPVVLAAARVYRRLLVGPTFIGITGSAAKTTTKDLLAEVLGTTLRGTKTPANDNRVSSVARTILGTKLRDSFSIAEVAAWRPGSVAEVSKLVRPGIAVVTTIGLDHRSRFRSLDAIAAEKGALVAALPADGIAVLNADDPQVIAMAEGFPGHVITFGEDPGAMVRAEDVHSSWPEHLRFTLCLGGRRYPVRTRLNGRHWTTSVLASFAVAVAMDVPVESALPAVAAFEPMGARMNAVEVDGITFVRDDNKSPYWSLGTVLDFVAEARAERTVLVLGTLSDYAGSASIKYRQSAERALAVADEVVFVGRNSKYALKARTNGGGNLSTFLTVREAAEHFRTELRPGDLVVLKGSNRADHLLRLFLTRTTDVRCWRTACGRRRFCDACELLHVPEEPPAARA